MIMFMSTFIFSYPTRYFNSKYKYPNLFFLRKITNLRNIPCWSSFLTSLTTYTFILMFCIHCPIPYSSLHTDNNIDPHENHLFLLSESSASDPTAAPVLFSLNNFPLQMIHLMLYDLCGPSRQFLLLLFPVEIIVFNFNLLISDSFSHTVQ